MALDPNIILAGRPAQFDNPIDTANKALTMKQLATQSRLQDQEIQEQDAIKAAFAKNVQVGPDGQQAINRKGVLSELYKINPMKGMEADKQWQAQNAQEQELKMKQLKQHIEIGQQLAGSVPTDPGVPIEQKQAAWTQLKLQGKQFGLPNNDSLPDQYPGDQFVQRMQMGLMTAKERMEQQWKEKEFGLKEKELALKDRESRSKVASAAGDAKNYVPGVGVALTADDAKTLKDAREMKDKFDRDLTELIKLRKDYGVEYANRNAVERGKQLSKKLLLTYKNLAKLGVLSKSDEDIVNAIIPDDPLGHDGSIFQDSILHRLEKFKGDLDADYETTLSTRLKRREAPNASSGNGQPSGPLIDYDSLSDDELDKLVLQAGGEI